MRNNEERLGVQQHIQDSTPVQQLVQQDGQEKLSLNFIVPTEFVDLPSKGKFYPTGHPLHGRDVIEIKQMTAKEEDILTSRSLLKKGAALDKLIASLIVDKNINPDTLTIEDRNAIIVTARISGYGAEYVTSVVCPLCSEKIKFTFDLSQKLPKEEEETVDINVDTNGLFTVQLPSTKWSIVCRAMNGNDEKTLMRMGELKKKSSNDSLLLEQLKLMVFSVQGVTDRQQISDALEMLPAKDSKYLRKVYSQVIKPFDMRQNFVCSKCEYEADMEVPLSADFFWFK